MEKLRESKESSVLCIDPERVILVDKFIKWKYVQDLLQEQLLCSKVLGFDCEWITGPDGKSRKVSLLQLATTSGLCILIRLHLLEKFPEGLQCILEDKSIIKVGVACLEDARRLMNDYNLNTRGCLDLRHLAVRCGLHNSLSLGLKALAAVVLDISLEKKLSVRASNWEFETLSKQQITYGAKDALIGVFIFWRLISIKTNSDNLLCAIDDNFVNKSYSFCQGLTDLKYTEKFKTSSMGSSKSGHVHKEPKSRAYVVRQSPLYHNCQMIAPDGQLLCTCDMKKANWYLEKGLAEQISENPLKLKLTFEPSGRPLEEQNYYTQDKMNICVVCGAEDTYIRKSIVPHEYRKYFPPVMKEHRSHDILLMCLMCHQRSNIYDQALKKELAEKCNAPLDTDKKFQNDENLMKVKSAARALYNHHKGKSKIPEERLQELQTILQDYFSVKDVGLDLIYSAKEVNFKVKSTSFISHGEKVIKYMSQHDGLIEFERMWRQKFLDNMKPKFLPHLWSVDHHHYQLTNMEYQMKVSTQTDKSHLKFCSLNI